MTTAGLRELRQRASDLVRAAEGGEVIEVTVSGRVAAQLGPVERGQWRRYDDVRELWHGPGDSDWSVDRDRVDQGLHDPFAR